MAQPKKTLEQQLISAARRGHVAPIKKLVAAGAKVNAQDDEKNLDLWSDGALRGSNWREAKLPFGVKKGAAGNTALMWALQLRRISAAAALLDAGADPRVRNIVGETALHLVGEGAVRLIDKMVEAGADVNARNIWGATPLMMAIYLGHVEVAKKLMEHGALLDIKTPGGLDAKTLLARNGAISQQDADAILALEKKAEYVYRLKTQDWYYQYSDDNRAYNAGSNAYSALSRLQGEIDPDCELWNKHAPKEYRRGDEILTGRLEAFFETGTEGTYWAFQEDGKTGYDGLHILKDGDLLTVFNDASDRKLWKGKIDLDREANKQPLPLIPSLTVQWVKAIGTVHGVQRGVDPEAWAKMFLDEKPAQLIVRNKPKP